MFVKKIPWYIKPSLVQQWDYYGSNKLHKTQFVPGTVNPVKRHG